MQEQLKDYIGKKLDVWYKPYYEGLRYKISNYEEKIEGNKFTATFLFTMYHLDTAGDVPEEMGEEKEGNFDLQAKGTILDGKIQPDIEVLGDVSVSGSRDYSAHLEEYFHNKNSTLNQTGYVKYIDLSLKTLEFDKAFYLTPEKNSKLLNSLRITKNDIPKGYYIYNKEKEFLTLPINEDAVFKILDTANDRDWALVDCSLEIFATELNSRTNLYNVIIKNGEVVEVSEKYLP